MTAVPWDAGLCLWPDDGAELDRQLAEAERGYWSRADLERVPPQPWKRTETVTVVGGVL